MKTRRLLILMVTLFAGLTVRAGLCRAEPDPGFETSKLADFHFRPVVRLGRYVAGELMHNDRRYLYVGCAHKGKVRRYIMDGNEVDAGRVAVAASKREIVVEGHLPGSGSSSFFHIFEFNEECDLFGGRGIPPGAISFNSIMVASKYFDSEWLGPVELKSNDKEQTPITLRLSIHPSPMLVKNKDPMDAEDSIGNMYLDEVCRKGDVEPRNVEAFVSKAMAPGAAGGEDYSDYLYSIVSKIIHVIRISKKSGCVDGNVPVKYLDMEPFEL